MVNNGASAVVPRLRFPEFRKAGQWRVTSLGRIAERVTTKNSDGRVVRVLTNSAEFGVLDQRDYFKKDIATAGKVGGYYIVDKGDYVYNPRTSAIAPVGPISRNNLGEGVMSPLYTVFRFSGDLTDFYEHYFTSTGWHSYVRSAASTGARHDRMSISTGAFMSMPVPTPSPEEQQKIADCLTSLDEVIAAQGRKVEALKTHKRGLMQQLFPREGETRPRLRFPEFRNAPEWKLRRLGELAKRGSGHTPNKSHAGYYNGGIKWVSLADSKRLDGGFISETTIEISEQGIANSSAVLQPAGSVILCRDAGIGKSAVMKEPMAVSQHFMVWTCNERLLSNWYLYHLFQLMKPLFEDVASGSTIKTIGLPFFTELKIIAPPIAEQQRIADCLSSLDTQIAAETCQLTALKTHKQGLMQQLFPVPETIGA